MSERDQDTFRTKLNALADRLNGNVTQLQNEAFRGTQSGDPALDAPAHQADPGAKEAEEELALTLLGKEGEVLAEVNAALARLDAGTFGKCEACGKAIPRPRLDALPYTPHCIDCARAIQTRDPR